MFLCVPCRLCFFFSLFLRPRSFGFRFQNNANNNNHHHHHQQLILSRKSSASSTGSLDKQQQQQQQHHKNGGSGAKVRHDEHSMKSVRDKIALFSSQQGKGGGRCHHQSTEDIMARALSSNSLMMTRAYTHGDVRYLGDAPASSGAAGNINNANVKSNSQVAAGGSSGYHRSMVNVRGGRSAFMAASNKSVSSADLSAGRRGMPATNGRSQSLLEIGNVVINNGSSSGSSNRSHLNTLPKSESQSHSRSSRSSLTSLSCSSSAVKKESQVTIQESHRESVSSPYNSLETDMSDARQVSLDGGRISLTTPPWKSTSNNVPKYSPAFKRKPFTVYSTGNVKPPSRPGSANSSSSPPSSMDPTQSLQQPPSSQSSSKKTSSGSLSRRESMEGSTVGSRKRQSGSRKSDDSDNDSAVSSGRSSMSHGSVSPPTSPSGHKTGGGSVAPAAVGTRPVPVRQNSKGKGDSIESARVLKKNSVEAINRRNVLESCKKSNGLSKDKIVIAGVEGKKTSITEFRAIEAKELVRTGGPATTTVGNMSAPRSITSLGKPASRSSSFTIAERKKSFESMSSRLSSTDSRRGSHSSQDSLTAKRSSREQVNALDNSFSCSGGSTNSRRSSRDTIGEEEVLIPTPSSRRSSRSEADGGSRVTTPTKINMLPTSPEEEMTPTPDDRSSSVTPTERRIVSRTNSIASERSTYSNRSSDKQQQQQPVSTANPSNNGVGSRTGYSRSMSVVSKDSGLPEEASSPPALPPKESASSDKEKWSTLEKKYSSKSIIGDAKNKIAKFDHGNSSSAAAAPCSTSGQVERPRDLSFNSVSVVSQQRKSSTASLSSVASVASKKTSQASVASPGSKSIRELTEKFELSTNSLTSVSSTSSVSTVKVLNQNSSSSSCRKDSIMSTMSSVSMTQELPESNLENNNSGNGGAAFRLGPEKLLTNYVSASWLEESNSNASKSSFFIPEESADWESFDPSSPFTNTMSAASSASVTSSSFSSTSSSSVITTTSTTVSSSGTKVASAASVTSPMKPLPGDRKFSVPIYNTNGESAGVKMRDKKDSNVAPSRPSSLIETSTGTTEMKVFEIGNLGGMERSMMSSSTSRGSSQADLLDGQDETPVKSPLLPNQGGPGPNSVSNRELMEAFMSKEEVNRRCCSVNDIRRAFEKAEQSLTNSISRCSKSSTSSSCGLAPSHNRMSSLDSTTSDESSIPTPHYYGSVSSLLSGHCSGTNLKDHYGSISSLASSTSLISPQVEN